uniref:Uncharacterized protein n=1 Tax=viral metagenome TaxID=1070528 RepID=A0A6C0B9M7_9ZZZZ
MHVSFNLFFSLLHFILFYVIFITALLSSQIKILLVLLIVMIFIKYLFFIFQRCILSLLEYNDHYPSLVEIFAKILSSDVHDKQAEEICINTLLLIILNKMLFLILFKVF